MEKDRRIDKARSQREKLSNKSRIEGRIKVDGKSKEWVQRSANLWKKCREEDMEKEEVEEKMEK